MNKRASLHLEGLNDDQRQAVLHDTGPAMVIAGAGTGKTRVITSRIAYLIEQAKALPEEILALTFTDKAAKEMEERVDQLLPYGYVDTQIMTFHALGNSVLQEHGFEIGLSKNTRVISNLQQHVLLRTVLEEFEQLEYFRPHHNPGQFREVVLAYFSKLKDEGLGPDDFTAQVEKLSQQGLEDFPPEEQAKYHELAVIYQAYQQRLLAEGFTDYGDQLLLTLQLLRDNQHVRRIYQKCFKYILVDEFQDTNRVQAELLQYLCSKSQNLMVVGDDDQSIYRFRGAELQNMLDFQDRYKGTRVIVLTENYRSTQHIVDTGYQLIQHNNPERLEAKARVNKRLHAQVKGRAPKVVQLDTIHDEMTYIAEGIEAHIKRGIALETIAVLCRNNSQAAELIQYMKHRGIPVASHASKNLLHEVVIRQCLDFVRVLHDEADSAALYRYLTSPRGGATTAELMRLSAEAARKRTSLAEVIEADPEATAARNGIKALAAYRDYAQAHSIGEVLYKFISDSGYLDRLVEAAQTDAEAGKDVQSLAAFFTLVKDFEAVETHRDSYTFWRYIEDMYSTDVLDEAELMDPDEGIHILTAHRSKGLEFEVVYLFDLTEQTFPARRKAEPLKLPSQIEAGIGVQQRQHEAEERRLMYVALTRAKRDLTMTFSLDHGGKRAQKPSRFLLEAFGKDVSVQDRVLAAMPAVLTRFGPRMRSGDVAPSFPENNGWIELTPNQIADYLADPSRFFVRHVLHFPSPPSHQMIYGVAIHAALEYFYREKQAKRIPDLQTMLSIFQASWRSEGFVSLRHEKERFSQGERSLRAYFTRYRDEEIEILAVETPFRCEISDIKVRIRGRYDLVVGDGLGSVVDIRDFKTSQVANERVARDKVRDTVQLGVYAYAWDQANKVKTTSISLYFTESQLLSQRNKIEHAKTLKKIAEASEGIRANRYPRRGNQTNLEIEGLFV
ncbi:MAG: ATP-dependent DNA helicase [Candidatus Saccharibacteria bacterium]